MKTIAQELDLYEAIHDELCIEIPKKDLADNELSKAFYDDNDINVFVFLEQTESELNLTYSFAGEKYNAIETAIITRVGGAFMIKCSVLKDVSHIPFFAEILEDKIYYEILPVFYKNVQYWVEQEREESEKQANKEHNAFLDQMQGEVS